MTDYFVEGGDILKNKLGIFDSEQLRKAEEDAFSDAVANILSKRNFDQKPRLDFEFFKHLHNELFGEIYTFAGQIRTVNIAKQDSSIPFCYSDFIEQEANRIFTNLASKNYFRGENKTDFTNDVAELAIDLNALHPFREGNGRTIRFYLQLLANDAGYILGYDKVTREEIIEADKQAFLGKDQAIKKMYSKIITEI